MAEITNLEAEHEIEIGPLAVGVQFAGGGGNVTSVNGQTGNVVLDAADVGAATAASVNAVASDVQQEIADREAADTALSNAISAETTAREQAVASLQSADTAEASARQAAIDNLTTVLATETANRETADTELQSQIDALSSASDVKDIVGTYAQLRAYDTSTLSNNDIIKVLQDENQNDETTYYRWSTATQTFTLIGEEGPYYTKSEANSTFVLQTRTVNGKALSQNISLDASDVGAVGTGNVVQTTGAATDKVMSQDATTTALAGKQDTLIPGANITIGEDGKTISATNTTYSDFTGTDGTTAGTAGLVPAPATTDADKFLKSDGTWGTAGGGSTVISGNVNLWQLAPGMYEWVDGVTIYTNTNQSVGFRGEGQMLVTSASNNNYRYFNGYIRGTLRSNTSQVGLYFAASTVSLTGSVTSSVSPGSTDTAIPMRLTQTIQRATYASSPMTQYALASDAYIYGRIMQVSTSMTLWSIYNQTGNNGFYTRYATRFWGQSASVTVSLSSTRSIALGNGLLDVVPFRTGAAADGQWFEIHGVDGNTKEPVVGLLNINVSDGTELNYIDLANISAQITALEARISALEGN